VSNSNFIRSDGLGKFYSLVLSILCIRMYLVPDGLFVCVYICVTSLYI
jgi:hypothetical protein